jgi:hypothetical protein
MAVDDAEKCYSFIKGHAIKFNDLITQLKKDSEKGISNQVMIIFQDRVTIDSFPQKKEKSRY